MPTGDAAELDLTEDSPSRCDRRLRRWIAIVREWRRRSRTRTALARFDDRMLADMRITRADACREINKPFWRP